MDKSKVLVDLGLVYETMLGADITNPVQLRYTVTLDHVIDDELIVKAWERTKRVYPIIDSVMGYEHGGPSVYMNHKTREKYMNDHLYLIEANGGVNIPVKTKVPVQPGSDVVGGRLICISYYEKTVSISSYHTLVDGGGLNMVFSTFLYSYFALYTGHEDEKPVVELTEGRNIKDYYTAALMDVIFLQEYIPTPIYSLPKGCRGFLDQDMVNDENIYQGSINAAADDLIKFCKENGANPSSMICVLLAKAAYALNPDEQSDIVFELTVSIRRLLGIETSISNALSLATAYTTRYDMMNKPISETARKIRKDVDLQRTKDYYVSFCRFFNTYRHSPRFNPRIVTYMGKINIGDNNCHIVDFNMETNGKANIYLMQLNDKFKLMIQYGKATQKYLNEFIKIFSELGIKAEIAHSSHYVLKDSAAAVL